MYKLRIIFKKLYRHGFNSHSKASLHNEHLYNFIIITIVLPLFEENAFRHFTRRNNMGTIWYVKDCKFFFHIIVSESNLLKGFHYQGICNLGIIPTNLLWQRKWYIDRSIKYEVFFPKPYQNQIPWNESNLKFILTWSQTIWIQKSNVCQSSFRFYTYILSGFDMANPPVEERSHQLHPFLLLAYGMWQAGNHLWTATRPVTVMLQ